MSVIQLRVAIEPIRTTAMKDLLAQPNQTDEGAKGTSYHEETLK